MRDREAVDLVLRSAEAHAGGHQDCHRIHEAIDRVRAILKVAHGSRVAPITPILSGHHARGTAGLEHPAPAQSPAHAGGVGQSP
jgi:hypothetical protein